MKGDKIGINLITLVQNFMFWSKVCFSIIMTYVQVNIHEDICLCSFTHMNTYFTFLCKQRVESRPLQSSENTYIRSLFRNTSLHQKQAESPREIDIAKKVDKHSEILSQKLKQKKISTKLEQHNRVPLTKSGLLLS